MKHYSISLMALLCFVAGNTFGQSADLDQYRNGKATAPITTGSNWVNGNAGASNSHYIEGYSIAYRCVMSGLPTSTNITITFGYDVKHSDHFAIDYLTQYHRLDPHTPFGHAAEPINPAAGTGLNPAVFGTFAIPAPSSTGSPVAGMPTNSFNALPAGERVFTIYGGSISNITYVNPQADLSQTTAETQISVTFSATGSTVVLAWGGHIGSRNDWGYDINGVPLSAAGISGSPYHMRTIGWTLGSLGNQDRSLSASAVAAPPTCDITPLIQNLCNGGSFSITAQASSGNGPFTYQWSGPNGYSSTTTTGNSSNTITVNNANPNYTGVYTVLITDNSGQTSSPCQANVYVGNGPVCSVNMTTNNSCPGSSNTFTAPTGMTGYTWSVSGAGAISGPNDQSSVTVISGGNCSDSYTVSVTLDSNGCTSTCSQLVQNQDNTPPQIINCPADYTMQGDNGSGHPCADNFTPGPVAIFVPDQTGSRSPVGVDFRQARNANHPVTPINWTGGVSNLQQSDYYEGIGVPQRIIFTGIQPNSVTGNTHTLLFKFEAVKHQSADRHAYDFLMSWEQAVASAGNIGNSSVNELQDLIAQTCNSGISSDALNACLGNTYHALANIPDHMGNPPNHHGIGSVDQMIQCFEGVYGDRNIEIVGNSPISGASLVFDGYDGGPYGDNYAFYSLTWTSTSTDIMVKVAARPAVGFGICGYGSCWGAGKVNGAPYHFILELLDGKSLGRRDNQVMVGVLDCNLNIPIIFGAPTAMDNCAGPINPAITTSDAVTYPTQNSIRHCRTWTATDNCSNSTQCTQCITVDCSNPAADNGNGERMAQDVISSDMMYHAYPNPFKNSVMIEFNSDVNAHATVEVFNAAGEKVATVFDADTEEGSSYKSQFDSKELADGIYTYRIINGGHVYNGKLTLIK
jgi:hypothetical protein